MPGTARIGPIEMTGLLGHTSTVSASAMASSTPGAGRASAAPSKRTPTTGGSQCSRTNHSCMASSPSGVVMRVATRSSVIGSRRGPSSQAAVTRAVASLSVAPSREQPGAEEVRGEVLVAESEPRVLAVAGEGVDGGEGLAREAPAGVGVLGPGERVGDRVEVGAHVETVEPVVVGGVHDDGDVGRVDDLHQTAQEPGRPHTPCQRCDHGVSVPADPSEPPRCVPGRVARRSLAVSGACGRATVRCRPP